MLVWSNVDIFQCFIVSSASCIIHPLPLSTCPLLTTASTPFASVMTGMILLRGSRRAVRSRERGIRRERQIWRAKLRIKCECLKLVLQCIGTRERGRNRPWKEGRGRMAKRWRSVQRSRRRFGGTRWLPVMFSTGTIKFIELGIKGALFLHFLVGLVQS